MKNILLILILLPNICFASSSFWIVQNIGTLTLRVYEKTCDNCLSTMILEAPMIVGKNEKSPENSESYQTQLGFFKIKKWNKFYVDGKEAYIRWDGRKIPKRGLSRKSWGLQGAFGVYAATLEPNVYQHLHGTIGWPNEGSRFIEHEKKEDGTLNRIGSKGCTRVDNQVIMFLRNFVPENTPLIRIYAKEKEVYRKDKINYKNWTYVFYETPDLKVDRPLDYENRNKIKEINIFEVGDFKYKVTPEIQPLILKSNWNSLKINGNPYEIEDFNLKGYFNIDTGLLSKDYENPTSLIVGGEKIPTSYFEK